jgi:hypothetical protein
MTNAARPTGDSTPSPDDGTRPATWSASHGFPVVGTDHYEVLAGGYFVVHHVDVTVGEQPVRAIEVIGEPGTAGGYLARSFDSVGKVELMRVAIDEDGVFHFVGGPDIAAAAQPTDASTARVRSTLTVADDRRSMTAFWERSEDGINWHPWMDIRSREGTDAW